MERAITVSQDRPTVREVTVAVRELVLGWDRYREAVADELGMGTSEVVALGFLCDDGPRTPSDIGHRLSLTSGSVTALIDRLEAAAFVTRSQNPDDRRSLLAAPTPAGRHAMQWFLERIDELIGAELDKLPGLTRSDVIAFVTATGTGLAERAQESREQQRR
jgi:DNA-binding MarR family transcriptional regulator